tara:strand:+ start:2436 stop:3065 length:630 start_codon:yes stop_codon:yes gene_type:complete
MKIDIKKSIKPVKYNEAISFLEQKLVSVYEKKSNELIWILEHPSTFTAGKIFNENEILDKKIKLVHTSRGGKITWHGPGQLICYFVIDLNKRNRDIRKFIKLIEKTIIKTLHEFKIKSFNDRKNIGIWIKKNNEIFKVAAIGIKIKKWIAYHGFSINIKNNLKEYNKIIPCGIKNKKMINLKKINNQGYENLSDKIVKNFVKNLENEVF